jgi:predicted Rossmann-fold nucleotide-binding protein
MLKIAVIGTSLKEGRPPFSEEVIAKTRKVGEILAKKGVILTSGGGNGLPWEATKAYKLSGGTKSIGYVGAIDAGDLTKRFTDTDHSVFDEVKYLNKQYLKFSNPHDFLMRELMLIEEADGVLCLQGRSGTLSELSFALQYRKPLAILTGLGGVADSIGEVLRAFAEEEIEEMDNVLFDGEVEVLVDRLIEKTGMEKVKE